MQGYPDAFTDPANYSLGAKPPSPTLTPSRYKFGLTPAAENRFPSDPRRTHSTYGLYDSSRERVRAPSLYNARSSHFESSSDSYHSGSAVASGPLSFSYARAYDGPNEIPGSYGTFESHRPRDLGGYREASLDLEEDDDNVSLLSSDRSLNMRHSTLPDMLPDSPVQSRFPASAFGGGPPSEDPISSAFANLRPSSSTVWTSQLEKVECKVCGETLASSQALDDHKKVAHHQKDKPFKCQSCEMTFARKYDCDRHERIHTGERPYQCSQCGQTFARRDALNRHTMLRCVADIGGTARSSLAADLPPAPAPGAFNRIRRSSSRVF